MDGLLIDRRPTQPATPNILPAEEAIPGTPETAPTQNEPKRKAEIANTYKKTKIKEFFYQDMEVLIL